MTATQYVALRRSLGMSRAAAERASRRVVKAAKGLARRELRAAR